MNNLVFFDLDDTLFNTEKLKLLTSQFIKDIFGAEVIDFKAEYDLVKLENNGIYSIVKHIQKYVPEVSFLELRDLFCEYFSSHELVFDYTEPIINHLQATRNTKIVILTFGEEDAQSLKLCLYPKLAELDIIVVQVPKIQIFRERLHQNSNGTLVFEGIDGVFQQVHYYDDRVDEGLSTEGNFIVEKIEKGGLNLEMFLQRFELREHIA